MDTTPKNVSIRCDLHPPLSAIVFCDACSAFLCRICSEVRPGGRVCATCKKPCREPSGEEVHQLVALRRKAKEDAALAKTAESSTKNQLDQAKVDREARLKAEFAARKAALVQQQSGVNAAPLAPLPVAPVSSARPFNQPLSPAPISGTMYNPASPASRPIERDPLAKLGERAHINVIGRAKTYMMIIGVLTMLIYGVLLFIVLSIENAATARQEPSVAEEVTSDIRKDRMTKELKANRDARLEAVRKQKEAEEDKEKNSAGFLIVKVILGAFFLVGVTMIVLFFLCESYPREATLAALIIYSSLTLLDVIASVGRIGFIGLFFKIAAITALYKGMIAGQTLQKMRDEEAAYARS